MKKRHIFIINAVFAGLIVFSAAVVVQFMTGRKPLSLVSLVTQDDKPVKVTTSDCSQRPGIAKLPQAKASGLRKLALFQQACHSYVTGTEMVFVGMPLTTDSAVTQARQTAGLLKEYHAYGVRPLVIAEPTDYTTSVNIDFGDFASGKYAAMLDTYFKQLKADGVTDAAMGIWNPFPEANLPYWQNNQPEYFAPCVNLFIATMRKTFPSAASSIMLNSATYQTTDFNWENGDYSSWLPYIKGLTPGSIDYAGMQGFPWVSPQGGNGIISNAAEFLNPDILIEAAGYLKVKHVWYNTGTFGAKYALDPERKRDMTPEQRKAILNTVEDQVKVLQSNGLDVAVNVFAEDKSRASEETDWSYWKTDPFSSPAAPVFTEFVRDMQEQKADIWVFDK